MSEREKVIREAIKILQDFYDKENREAGNPMHWCVDEGLHSAIEQLKYLVGDGL